MFQSPPTITDFHRVFLIDEMMTVNVYNQKVLKKRFPESTIEAFKNPLEALVALKKVIEAGELQSTLFLIEVRMSQIDGFEFVDLIDELYHPQADERPNWRFVALTIDDSIRTQELVNRSTLLHGALPKPLNIAQLENLLMA